MRKYKASFLLFLILSVSCKKNKVENLSSHEMLIESIKDDYENDQYAAVVRKINQMNISSDSLEPELLFMRGYSYMQIDSFSSAALDFQKSAKVNFNEAQSYYNLSLINIAFLNDSLAKKYAELTLLYDPKHEKAKNIVEMYKN